MSLNRSVVVIILSVGLALVGAACNASGFTFRSLVQVETPPGIQQDTGLPKKLPLPRAELEYQDWYDRVKRDGTRWKASIEQGQQTADLFDNLVLGTIEGALGPAAATTPGLALALGYFIRRRGDVTAEQLRKEKEESYNAGLELGKKLAEKIGGDRDEQR